MAVADLQTAVDAVWQCIDALPDTTFNTKYRHDGGPEIDSNSGVLDDMPFVPAIEVWPGAALPEWFTNRDQMTLFTIQIRIWTNGWRTSQPLSLSQQVREKIWARDPSYIKTATCYHPVKLTTPVFKKAKYGTQKGSQITETTMLLVLRVKDDPL